VLHEKAKAIGSSCLTGTVPTRSPSGCPEQARALGTVRSERITFPSGYAYEFTPGPKREFVQKIASFDLTPHRNAMQWALDTYAEKSAVDLELLSTFVCADREASQARRQMAFGELGRKVKQVKPRFSEATILRNINELARAGMLVASSPRE
jgi:hypothetical protein